MQQFLDMLFPPRADEVLLRTQTPESFASRYTPIESYQLRDSCLCLLPLSNEYVRAAIHEAKYHESRKAFALLSSALTKALMARDSLASACLVPIPLGALRRRERGYNQVEVVVRRAGSALGIPADTSCLERTRETCSQVTLSSKERRENMRGAFTAPHELSSEALYIVCDDVLTTGATLEAAVSALRDRGARHVLLVAFAH